MNDETPSATEIVKGLSDRERFYITARTAFIGSGYIKEARSLVGKGLYQQVADDFPSVSRWTFEPTPLGQQVRAILSEPSVLGSQIRESARAALKGQEQ